MAVAAVWFIRGRKVLGPQVDDVPNPLTDQERTKVVGLAVGALAGLWRHTVLDQIIDAISIVALLTPIAYFTVMFRSPKVDKQEKSHLLA